MHIDVEMKAKLMAMALLFAILGYVNSHAASYGFSSDWIAGTFLYITGGASEAWFSSLWQLCSGVQNLLFLLQAAIGFVMIAYFLRWQRTTQKRSQDDTNWD